MPSHPARLAYIKEKKAVGNSLHILEVWEKHITLLYNTTKLTVSQGLSPRQVSSGTGDLLSHIPLSMVATLWVVGSLLERCRPEYHGGEVQACGCTSGSSAETAASHYLFPEPLPPLQHSPGTALSLCVESLSTFLLLTWNRNVFSTESEWSHLGQIWEGRTHCKNTSCSF